MVEHNPVQPSQQADPTSRAQQFLKLHVPGRPLLMPNAWDIGSAKALAELGFEALATTSSGFAATLGRLDGSLTREDVLSHAEALADAVDVPVSADLENCFAHDPAGVAETIRLAGEVGLGGASIEDFNGDGTDPIYEFELAVARVGAAVEVAHQQSLVLT